MKLWLVGKRVGDWDEQGEWQDSALWEVQGIFSTRELADAACHDKKHFLGAMELDVEAPAETVGFDEFAYPRAPTIPQQPV